MSTTNNKGILLWKERIQACKASNISIKRWCRENSVSHSAYRYWFRKLNSKSENIETKWAEITIEPEKNLVFPEQSIILHFYDFKI